MSKVASATRPTFSDLLLGNDKDFRHFTVAYSGHHRSQPKLCIALSLHGVLTSDPVNQFEKRCVARTLGMPERVLVQVSRYTTCKTALLPGPPASCGMGSHASIAASGLYTGMPAPK